jgi:hypothetical protein
VSDTIYDYDFTEKAHCLDRVEIDCKTQFPTDFCCSGFDDGTKLVRLKFHNALSEPNKTILDGIIAAHTATPPCNDLSCPYNTDFPDLCPYFAT